MGETEFIPLAGTEELERLFARSHDGPVILFKHSNTCPISSAAYREMKRIGGDVALVVVQKARDVSRAVESRTGIRHESPQALVLRGGVAVWSASHWNITAETVADALREQREAMKAKG